VDGRLQHFRNSLAVGILTSFGIINDPAVGAILMSLSTVLVAINSQTLRRYEPKSGELFVPRAPTAGHEVMHRHSKRALCLSLKSINIMFHFSRNRQGSRSKEKLNSPKTIYLITRTHGLKQHLLKSKDFIRMSRAKNLKEMSDFLLETDYAAELTGISEKESDGYQMEKIFYKRLSERLSFLLPIASGKIREALEGYCRKLEVENLKKIIRSLHGKERIDEDRLIPIPRRYQTVDSSALVETSTVDEMIGFLNETPYRGLKDGLDLYENSNNPLVLETKLEKIYYSNLWAKLEKIADKGEVRKLIGTEIDLKNMLNFFSFRRMNIEQELFEEMTIKIHYRLPRSLNHKLISSSYEAISEVLTWPPYVELAKKAADLFDRHMLTEAEHIFPEYLYSYAETVSIRKPNSLVYVFAYLLLCFREARNLTALAIGKQLKLEEEKILVLLFL
jgi:V/A-type H+-transporting ATPase subunit C